MLLGWESFQFQRHQINVSKEQFFFQHYGLTHKDLERYLAAALSAGGEYADLYFEYLTSTALMVDESMLKSASQGISAGCGVRVVAGNAQDTLTPTIFHRSASCMPRARQR